MSSRLNSSRKVVLLLMTPSTYRASDFLAAGRAAGLEVVVGTSEPQTLAGLMPDGHLTLPWDDPARAVRKVAEFARSRPLHAVVAVDDEGVLLAAAVSRQLGLPHNSSRSVALTLDKAAMRQRLAGAGLSTPRFMTCSGPEDLQQVESFIGFPCVVKPLHLSGSLGVIRVQDRSGLAAAVDKVVGLLKRPDLKARRSRAAQAVRTIDAGREGRPGDGAILVEEYIPGREVALEGLLRQGKLDVLALFDKPDLLVGPFFQETVYVTPSREPSGLQAAVRKAAAATAGALGLSHGPVHGEFRINSRGIWPLEMAARSIGGLCSRTLRFGTGFSLEDLILRQACGLEIPSVDRESGASGVMMIPIPTAGTLVSVSGRRKARQVEGIQEVLITIPVGGEVIPPPEGSRYLGFILAKGPTPQAAERSLRRAHRCLSLEIRPAPGVKP
ncbi:MAG: ATP-grasp domain-containing protein [Acidobacteriota bacterium]